MSLQGLSVLDATTKHARCIAPFGFDIKSGTKGPSRRVVLKDGVTTVPGYSDIKKMNQGELHDKLVSKERERLEARHRQRALNRGILSLNGGRLLLSQKFLLDKKMKISINH